MISRRGLNNVSPNVLRLKKLPLTLTLSRRGRGKHISVLSCAKVNSQGRGNNINSLKRTYSPTLASLFTHHSSLKKKLDFTLPEGATRVALPNSQRRAAFTLAEVLITLGIIGVVAAMTIPVIIGNYKKQKVETSLAKFYSVMNQALSISKGEHGEIFEPEWESEGLTGEQSTIWYREYITKYLKTVKEEQANRSYYRLIFLDGSGFTSWVTGGSTIFIFYCVDFSRCTYSSANFDGKNSFLFIYNRATNQIEPYGKGHPHSSKLNSCRPGNIQNHTCAALIQENGWKIPDDYPIKF